MNISEKLQTIAENEQKVYDEGMKAEYDAFWDAYQDYGNRTDYTYAFSGYGWTEETFKPKYDIVPTNAYMLARSNSIIIDLADLLERLAIKMDLSKATNTQYLFSDSRFTRIGVVDMSGSTNTVPLDGAFTRCARLVTIDKIVLKTGTNGEVSDGTFHSCRALENVTFEGLITKNGLNLQWSTNLSKASIESVINCLSTTTSGLSVTLSKAAVNKAFETSEGANDGATSTEWTTLIGTRSNWTISLV